MVADLCLWSPHEDLQGLVRTEVHLRRTQQTEGGDPAATGNSDLLG